MKEYKYEDLTYKITGLAMKIHRAIGLGFPEIIYSNCMIVELNKAGIKVEKEVERDIFYDGVKVGSRKLDLLVDDKVIVELKAVSMLEPVHQNQLLNYLKVFKIEVGLLINFGAKSLDHQRYALDHKIKAD